MSLIDGFVFSRLFLPVGMSNLQIEAAKSRAGLGWHSCDTLVIISCFMFNVEQSSSIIHAGTFEQNPFHSIHFLRPLSSLVLNE